MVAVEVVELSPDSERERVGGCGGWFNENTGGLGEEEELYTAGGVVVVFEAEGGIEYVCWYKVGVVDVARADKLSLAVRDKASVSSAPWSLSPEHELELVPATATAAPPWGCWSSDWDCDCAKTCARLCVAFVSASSSSAACVMPGASAGIKYQVSVGHDEMRRDLGSNANANAPNGPIE